MGIKLNEKDLKEMCKDLMRVLWDEEFDLPLKISGRMTRTFGYFITNRREDKALGVQFAKRLINGDYNIETIESVVKHELCHYYIFKIGKNHHDGSYDFETEIKRIGSSSTGTLKSAGEHHTSICSKCGKVTRRGTENTIKRRVNSGRYRSSCCKAPITYGGIEISEDTNKLAPVTSKLAQQINKKVATRVSEPIAPKEIKEDDKEQNTTNNNNILNINEIVLPGTRGVSGTQVYEAIKKVIDEDNPEKLKLIKEHYPKYFNQVCRYFSKKKLSYIQQVI